MGFHVSLSQSFKEEPIMNTARNTALVALTVALSGFLPEALAAKRLPIAIQDGVKFQGDLYVPNKAKGPLPLVVVVHEWWGKTDYPQMRGKKIADELGYAALVVDLYG